MSLEPILTPEEYESVCQFIAQYEARLAEKRADLDEKIKVLDEEHMARLARPYEIVSNLQSELSALRARAQDYEMHEMSNPCPLCNGNGAQGTSWMYDPDDWAEPCHKCNGTGINQETKLSGRWHAEVFNLSDLIKAAAANPEYEQYLQPVMPLLNKRAVKEKRTMYVPGVLAVQKVKPAPRDIPDYETEPDAFTAWAKGDNQ